jgi:hypothetical protein
MAEEEIRILQGEDPLDEDEKWLDYGRKLLEETPRILDEDAKSLVALGSSLLTVYTGVLALFKFVERSYLSGTNLAVMSIPIILWLLCISFSASVYFPGRYEIIQDSPDSVMKIVQNIDREKYKKLKVAAFFLILALGCSSFAILWVGQETSSISLTDQPQKVQFIIKEGANSSLNTSIFTSERIRLTVPLNLLESTDKTYHVRLPNGKNVELNRDLVEGIMYS